MYNNTVDRLITIANRPQKEKYKILTFPTHERYETQLCKTGHEFYALDLQNMKKWNISQTPVPPNYHILPENQLCSFLDYDFILVQSKFGQFQAAQQINNQLSLPVICLEHTVPTTSNQNQINAMKSMNGDVNVFISEYSKKSWGMNGVVIHHGIDTNKFTQKKVQNNQSVLTVANDFINRDYCLNYSGWKRVTNELNVRVVGETEGLSKPAASVDELVDEYNSCSVYFNSSTLSPIPTSLLEAMSCGCAVVSTATCMIPEIIKNGYNGYISNDERELTYYLKLVLNDERIRQELGKNARQTILDKFSEKTFIDEWNKLFNSIYEVSTR